MDNEKLHVYKYNHNESKERMLRDLTDSYGVTSSHYYTDIMEASENRYVSRPDMSLGYISYPYTIMTPHLYVPAWLKKTKGSEQLSWEYSSLVGDFYFSVTPQPVNEQVTDEKIYEFICARRKSYENASDNIYDIECLPYIDAYNKYHIPIIKILRAYSRVDYSKRGFQFSDATIDQLNSNYLSSWGFIQKYGRWYYKNHYVEMGDLLPLPEELEPKQPINGKELKIEASLSWKMNDGKIRFQVSSNIPEETPLMFTLRGKEYTAQCKSVAGNRISISEWFSDRGNPMKNGFYTIDVSCPIYSVLPEKIKKIFGERNRNICGQYVKFEPVGGNTIHFSYGLVLKNSKVQVIDMQQRISAL